MGAYLGVGGDWVDGVWVRGRVFGESGIWIGSVTDGGAGGNRVGVRGGMRGCEKCEWLWL